MCAHELMNSALLSPATLQQKHTLADPMPLYLVQVRATRYRVSLRMQYRKRSMPSLVRMHVNQLLMDLATPWTSSVWPCAVLQAVTATPPPFFTTHPAG